MSMSNKGKCFENTEISIFSNNNYTRGGETDMISYDYISSLDKSRVNLYTLQLANMKRIEQNDAVYIFDEVGAGKTISAGLSIIQLLFQSEKNTEYSRVLIVTAPSVVKQFESKLEDLLDLKVNQQGLYNKKEYTIKIINYDYRNIRKVKEDDYDFIIIDEAHEFLNEDTKRYQELVKLKAKKILFMTATPIKYSRNDLERYPQIASLVINKNLVLLKRQLIDACSDKKKLSGGFNPEFPVTRYFKETIRNIEKTEDGNDFLDKEPRRLVPELWEYDYNQNIDAFLADKIDHRANKENKFVIFVRYIKHTKSISDALKSKGFYNYFDTSEGLNKTFCVVTGKTANRRELLRKFSTTDSKVSIPDVLIITYKISEQGIDLPSYNYTVNYHIPATPSQLEQRFGRIDRLNSTHNELNTCFLLMKNGYRDSNTVNFYSAISTYIDEFLPLIPSKNCLVTQNILESFSKNNEYIVSYYERLLGKCEDQNVIDSIYNKMWISERNFEFDVENYSLISYIEDRNIEFDEDREVFRKNIVKEINRSISQVDRSRERIEWWKDNINVLSNDLFYVDTDDDKFDWEKKYDVKVINPKEVAKNIISLLEYSIFSEEVKLPIQIMRIWNQKKDMIELNIENRFHENQFDVIFPENDKFNWVWNMYFDCENNVISENKLNELVMTLPFYKMCEEYKQIVQSFAFNDKGYLYQKYDFNPFRSSLNHLFYRKSKLRLSCCFFDKYFDEEEKINGNPFYIKNENNLVKTSNWLKLLYMYSRKESFAIGAVRKDEMRYLFSPNSICTCNSDGGIKDVFLRIDNEFSMFEEIKVKNEDYVEEKDNFNQRIKNHFNCTWSLFNHFLYGFSNKRREKTRNAIRIDGSIYSPNMCDTYTTKEIIESYINRESVS